MNLNEIRYGESISFNNDYINIGIDNRQTYFVETHKKDDYLSERTTYITNDYSPEKTTSKRVLHLFIQKNLFSQIKYFLLRIFSKNWVEIELLQQDPEKVNKAKIIKVLAKNILNRSLPSEIVNDSQFLTDEVRDPAHSRWI